MNDHDRSNLRFIMSLDDDQFDAWSENIADDDIQYAIELIQQARLELAEQECNLLEFDLIDSDFAEARAVLNKFRL